MLENLSRILDKFNGLRVLVAGDLMVDEHIWGNATRVSPEAPVLVVDAIGDPDVRPGGAANVATNIRTLGASVEIVGVVGGDSYGQELTRQLSAAGVGTDGVIVDKTRLTTCKTRIWVSHRQQVARVDRETRESLNESVADELVSHLRTKLAGCDALVLSDYSKGVLTPSIASRCVELSRDMNKLCTANAKPVNISGFRGAGLVTLNQVEAETVAKVKLDVEDAVLAAGQEMRSGMDLSFLVITRGSCGLSIFGPNIASTIPAIPIEVYDVAGAGDTVISAITLALATGAEPLEAAKIANLAGGAAVRKVGVAAVTPDEILALA